MRPLTDHTPKPLLAVGGKPLIVWHLERLVGAGFRDIVINHAHLGDKIEAALGDGSQFGVRIQYSAEAEALETAGGIVQALPWLGDAPFLVVNGDIYCDFDFGRLLELPLIGVMAHLVLVDNPPQHLQGDFVLQSGRLVSAGGPRLTFSGIGVYRPELFAGIIPGSRAKLAPLLRAEIELERVSAEHAQCHWVDVGTPERLQALNQQLNP